MTQVQNFALILNLASDLTCDHPMTSYDQVTAKHVVIGLWHPAQYQNFALIPNLASDQQLAKLVGTGLWHMLQYQNFALIPNLASDLTCDHPVTS